MKHIALIVAGGSGTRMGADVPKQFLLLRGRPVLMHTIEKFHSLSEEVIVVLPENWISYWEEQCEKYEFNLNCRITFGGNTRAESVRNGLNHVPNNSIVAVHDAARPLISKELIERLYITAEKFGSAIPVVAIKDSLRIIEGTNSNAVDRSAFRLVQTPQCFQAEKLMEAFGQADYSNFSDEASLVQACGQEVHLIEGEASNVKITLPEDLFFAEHYILSY